MESYRLNRKVLLTWDLEKRIGPLQKCSIYTIYMSLEKLLPKGYGIVYYLYLEAQNNQNDSEVTKHKPLIISVF